jgi:predicted glycoside hydrolase/deacetylase ChbG (UPF0249 family)
MHNLISNLFIFAFMLDPAGAVSYSSLKAIASNHIKFGFIFPKLWHQCDQCKDEKQLIVECDAKFLEQGVEDREVYCIPIMNAVEMLQHLQILRKSDCNNSLVLRTLGNIKLNIVMDADQLK